MQVLEQLKSLKLQLDEGSIGSLVSKYAATRYKEGYIKGVHDYDATLILNSLLGVYFGAGLLKFNQRIRTLAVLFEVVNNGKYNDELFISKYETAKILANKLNNFNQINNLQETLSKKIFNFFNGSDLKVLESESNEISKYLSELRILNKNSSDKMNIEITKDAFSLKVAFEDFLTKINMKLDKSILLSNYSNLRMWVESFVDNSDVEGF